MSLAVVCLRAAGCQRLLCSEFHLLVRLYLHGCNYFAWSRLTCCAINTISCLPQPVSHDLPTPPSHLFYSNVPSVSPEDRRVLCGGASHDISCQKEGGWTVCGLVDRFSIVMNRANCPGQLIFSAKGVGCGWQGGAIVEARAS